MTATYNINQELNGIEISFGAKPEAATLDALKANGYRWHRAKKVWYAKQTAERLELAKAITDGQTATATARGNAKVDTINLDGLGENHPGYHSTDLTKAIREDLKQRGVSGCTVRAGRGGYTSSITVTIKATADDFASVEEMKKRYTFSRFTCNADRGFYDGENYVYNFYDLTDNEQQAEYDKYIRYQGAKLDSIGKYHLDDRADNWELSSAFYKKVCAIYKIANQWNYDKSDSMTDYFDVGYYLDLEIKKPDDFILRETMTEEEKAAYDAEKAEEAAWLEQYEKEQEERKKAEEAYQAQRKIDRELIEKNITIEDLPEEKRLYISGLVGGIGKESNLEELEKEIAENPHHTEAIITRKVIFATEEAYQAFTNYLIDDFGFLNGMGGTGSEDVRLEKINDFWKLNEEQRETVKFIACNCVGIYLNNDLMLVSNPEGYSYSRYTYKPTSGTRYTKASEETAKQRKESEEKTPFYFPEDVEKQAENIHEGQKITIYQTDGLNLCSVYGGFGTVLAVEPGTWAQYKGVYITLIRGGKGHKVFIRNDKKCLIYEGIMPPLPDALTKRRIDEHMSELLTADDLFPAILDYYGKQGQKPLIDTIQR